MASDWPSKSEIYGTFETLSDRLDDLDTHVSGAEGAGLPTGGSAGEVLTKDSGTNFDASWQAAGGAGVTPELVLVTMTASRNPLNVWSPGTDVADTATIKGNDGTAGTVPSWFTLDSTIDATYGFGIRFNEAGVYSGQMTFVGDYANDDLSAWWLELIDKATGYEMNWGFYTSVQGIRQVTMPFTVRVIDNPPVALRTAGSNVIEMGNYSGFTANIYPIIAGSSPNTIVSGTLYLAISKVV